MVKKIDKNMYQLVDVLHLQVFHPWLKKETY